MDKVEEISHKIEGWIKSNRMGDLENEPCYWSIYKIPSMSSKPVKSDATNSENISIEGLEPSLKHLLDCMSYSTHIKYFAVRLRTKKGDIGVMNNFQNPYYEAAYNYKSPSSIGNLPQAPQESNFSMMLGILNGINEERRATQDSTQAMLTELKLQNQETEHKLKEYKLKQEVIRLKEENASIGNASSGSFINEIIKELKPEIISGIKYLSNKNTPYEEEEDHREQEGEQKKDSDTQSVLNASLSMLSNKVNNPEKLIYKIAVVLNNIEKEESEQLLGAMQAQYNQIKQNKSANNEH